MAVQTIVASAARTTSTNSSAFAPTKNREVNLMVSVTAVSGTNPTLDVSVEWSPDGSAWYVADTADTFTQITAARKTTKQFTCKGPNLRVAWTIGGTSTPTFTFSVTAHTPITYVKAR